MQTGKAVMARLSLLVPVIGLLCSGVAQAAESAAVVTSHTRASLVSDVDVLPGPAALPGGQHLSAEQNAGQNSGRRGPGSGGMEEAEHSAPHPAAMLHVGLRLQLRPGWHTYWRNPGDAGEPAHVHVTVEGAYAGSSEQIDWPVPERISEGGLMAYAYQGDVLLPLHVPLDLPASQQERVAHGGRLHVSAQADWLVCADVCVPESGHFTLDLPVRAEGPARAGAADRVASDGVASGLSDGANKDEAGKGVSGKSVPRQYPGLHNTGPQAMGGQEAAGQIPANGGECAEAALFRRAEAAMPQPSPFSARITPSGLLQLSGAGLAADAVQQGWFLPQEGGVIAQNVPQPFTVQPGRVALQLRPDPYAHPPFWQKPLAGVLVLVDGAGNHSALQIMAQPAPAAMPPATMPADSGRAGVAGSDGAEPPSAKTDGAGDGTAQPGPTQPGPTHPQAVPSRQGARPQQQSGQTQDGADGKAGSDGVGGDEMQGLWGNLLSAFLGGVILNLMPCVFPVLAMKLLSLAHMGGAGWRMRWQSAAFYSAGVMGCFAVLGGGMMALRYGGAAVGWGFQFQSTGFVVGVGWLLFALALNLLGVFQITGGRLAGRAGQAVSGHGVGSDLLAGLLAVIVATPCTAPFMGVAIAAALAGPYWAGLLIFLAMGLGLAAPYVLLAFMPGLARRLPRPGLWMERLKQVLAFPLLASCVWLLWVAVLQGGGDAVLLMAGGAVLLGLGAWLYGLAQQRAMAGEASRLVLLGRLLAGLCLLACLAGLGRMVMTGSDTGKDASAGSGGGDGTGTGEKAGLSAPPSSSDAARNDLAQGNSVQGKLAGDSVAGRGRGETSLVEPFFAERLARLRAAGRPVLVDMTASWCVTCMVNEHVALDIPSTRQAFRRHGVILLRGDWTRRDERITAFLKAHGRDGVPLYIYYPPHGEGRMLPQILTPALMRDVLEPPQP